MKQGNKKKNKHLTFEDRQEIQDGLFHRTSFKDIARFLEKDPTTISKEVKKHIAVTQSNVTFTDAQGNLLPTPTCPLLLRAPFVCNGCKKRGKNCGFNQQVYYAKEAQKEYESLLSEAREGIPLNKKEFYEMDRVISEGINNGQHLYHIIETHDLKVSKSTIYRHLQKGYLSVSPVDFPRVTKFKARKQKKQEYVPKVAKIGRTYEDLLAYTQEEGIQSWVEMDTVIGKIGGKTLLTFDFTNCNFMFAYLLDDKSSLSVSNAFEDLRGKVKMADLNFSDYFPILLTDNGSEFSNVQAMEETAAGIKETQVFFCDPFQSCQKPKVEKNHTLLRDILPKGTSFDELTQEKVNVIFSHINSVKRFALNGKTSFEVFTFLYGDELPKALGIQAILAEKVVQSPKLLR